MKTIAIFLALMLPMTMSAQNYEAYHVNTKDNLSDNYVCDFAQDEQGVMWFATLRGVFSATTDTRSAASDWTRSNTAWDE